MIALKRFGSRLLRPLLADAAIVAVSLHIAWAGRSVAMDLGRDRSLSFVLLSMAVYCGTNLAYGLYNRLWRYASAGEGALIFAATMTAGLMLAVVDLAWPGGRLVPLSVLLMSSICTMAGFVTVRYRRRALSSLRRALWGCGQAAGSRVLLIGAGEAGQHLAWRLLTEKSDPPHVLVGFIDDDPAKHGMRVHGLPVLGDRQAIARVVAARQVDKVIIAISNISPRDKSDIITLCGRVAAVRCPSVT
jgi:FlaA1/EpsC-like NDP-sugar epimerase